MKIAFISANRAKLPDAVIPLGLLYLKANMPPGHESELWDLCFESEPLRFVTKQLQRYIPDVIAIGMRNLFDDLYEDSSKILAYYETLLAEVRVTTQAPIILGGGGFSVDPKRIMEILRPDFGIAGEGERAFSRLLTLLQSWQQEDDAPLSTSSPTWIEHLQEADLISSIENLHYFQSQRRCLESLIATPQSNEYISLESLHWPDRIVLDPRHFSLYAIDSVQTKRGCALDCSYCVYPLVEGHRVRLRDPVDIVREMRASHANHPNLRHVFIVDAVFNLPIAHAKAVCRELIHQEFMLPWTCYANPLGFDRELADLMVKAGCAGVEIGTDSGDEATLKRLRKGFHLETIRRTHALCHSAGLRDCHTFMLGTPGESIETVKRTLSFCSSLNPFAAIMMLWMDETEVPDADERATRRKLREDITELLQIESPRHPRWIVPSLTVKFSERLFSVLRRNGMHGPLWQYLDRAGR